MCSARFVALASLVVLGLLAEKAHRTSATALA